MEKKEVLQTLYEKRRKTENKLQFAQGLYIEALIYKLKYLDKYIEALLADIKEESV